MTSYINNKQVSQFIEMQFLYCFIIVEFTMEIDSEAWPYSKGEKNILRLVIRYSNKRIEKKKKKKLLNSIICQYETRKKSKY